MTVIDRLSQPIESDFRASSPESEPVINQQTKRELGHRATAGDVEVPSSNITSEDIFGDVSPADEAAHMRGIRTAGIAQEQEVLDAIHINTSELEMAKPGKAVVELAEHVLDAFEERRVAIGGRQEVDFIDDAGAVVAIRIIETDNGDGTQKVTIADSMIDPRPGERPDTIKTDPHMMIKVEATNGDPDGFAVFLKEPGKPETVIADKKTRNQYLDRVLKHVTTTVEVADADHTDQARKFALNDLAGTHGQPWSPEERRQGIIRSGVVAKKLRPWA